MERIVSASASISFSSIPCFVRQNLVSSLSVMEGETLINNTKLKEKLVLHKMKYVDCTNP